MTSKFLFLLKLMENELTPRQIYRRKYYQENKERAKQQIKSRYELKKDELLAYQKEYRTLNKDRIRERDFNKKKKVQEEAIEYLGGKCTHCQQSFPSIVYDFHHVNPSEKDFILSEHWGDSRDKIWNELDKCILLCANCHRIEHKGSNGRKEIL